MESNIRITAVGDIAFVGEHFENPSEKVFHAVEPSLKQSDFVIGNLESPFTSKGKPVPGKACLRGNPEWARILKKTGINIVSLANNHIMDYGEGGLHATLGTLKQSGIRYVGAGNNIKEANAPIFLEAAGSRIAVMARSSVDVKSRCYAGRDMPGAAFLEIDETIESIELCKKKCELILLVLHWGIEEYCYPSPRQRALAKRFFEAGIDIIIGHHPHVVQGIEKIGKGIVAYSLGNFVFDEFKWEINGPEKESKWLHSNLSEENRKGMILAFTLDGNKRISVSQIFTRIGQNFEIITDANPYREIEWASLNTKLKSPIYRYFWKIYAIRMEWELRMRSKLSINKIFRHLFKIRLKHFKELFKSICRSFKIAIEKSTNPYD